MRKLTKEESVRLEKLREELADAALQYNLKRQELEAFRDEIHERIENYIGEKSDKWQESDRGAAYQDWMQAWEEDVGEEVEETIPEFPEEPEGV